MKKFTAFQQKIIKAIVAYNPEVTDYRFEDLFQHVLKKHLNGLGIIINAKEVILFVNEWDYSQNYNKLRREAYEIIYLFYLLSENNFLVFMRDEEISEEIEEEIFEYNPYTKCKENIRLKTLKKYRKNLLLNLEEEFFISEELKELSKNDFKSTELKNLKITQRALYATVGLGIAGILASYYIALNVETVVDFKNPDVFNKTFEIKVEKPNELELTIFNKY
ncbi:hypothetical protein PM10SUCC1_33480 [Propionigenium maris DSM 9537]|uniref:Uncharacterized protein n=1 Tax=Propionigenium maris DSM 9537 TaxID=1123000 RepID=A0A9W6GMJ7_9FUSO|nr:hypothetical protein [Propionigenium maris]GLI57834.1 hypothetical protein PM10SUCC1_33480 [Propionigenium maris DSM 9537]